MKKGVIVVDGEEFNVHYELGGDGGSIVAAGIEMFKLTGHAGKDAVLRPARGEEMSIWLGSTRMDLIGSQSGGMRFHRRT